MRLTGTILLLPPRTGNGVIRSEEGFRFAFSSTDVVGDFDTLAVGHRVSFEIGHMGGVRIAVQVMKEPAVARHPKPVSGTPDLRYLGFDQAQEVREYKFDAVSTGCAPEHFLVRVELPLVRKHNISVQELPSLCMRKLAADLAARPQAPDHELAECDLTEFAAARAAKLERKRPKAPSGGHRNGTPPAWGGRRY